MQCVRISCQGDVDDLGVAPFVSLQIAENHPAMASVEPSSISKTLGLPILIQRYPAEFPCENVEQVDGPYTNTMAYRLDYVDPYDRYLMSWVKQDWSTSTGTVVIMREDQKDLDPHHAEALCHFCSDLLYPEFSTAPTVPESAFAVHQ